MEYCNNRFEMKNKTALILSSCFCTFMFILYAPLELYLTNISEFWFSLSHLLPLLCILALLSWLLLILVGRKMPLWMQNIYISTLIGMDIAMYIQANFLNLDVGVLNGADIMWSEYKVQFLLNFVVWVICISICIGLYNERKVILKKGLVYLSGAIFLIQLFTLVTLLIMNIMTENKNTATKYVSNYNIYTVSEENIVVFMLDMFDDRYFEELLRKNTDLERELEGFTYFDNSIGTYSTTSHSIATLLTGGYLRNSEETYYEEIDTLYEKCDAFNVLLDNDYTLDIYTYDGMIPTQLRNQTRNYLDGKIHISNYVEFTKNVYKLVACKYLPDFVKQYAWMVGTEFEQLREVIGDADVHSVDNVDFYNNLMRCGINIEGDKNFKFIYLEATHYPYTMNENGERVSEDETSVIQCAEGVLKIVQTYLEGMKAVGVYDDSAILIMADHGYYWDGVLTNPVLLVKPMKSTGNLQVNSAPVSHQDFLASVLSFAGLNEDGKYGKDYYSIALDDSRERLFYQYYLGEDALELKWRLIEYTVDEKGNERHNYHLTGNEYTVNGERIDHFANCKLCKNGFVDSDDPEARIVHR